MMKSTVVLLALMTLYGPSECQGQLQVLGMLKDLGETIEAAFSGYKYCPPPYHHVLGDCFYVHQYIPQLTWKESQDFCKQAGGIGAEPKHFGAVIAQLYNMGKATDIYNRELVNVWLGGRREDNSTSFKWWSSGKPIEEDIVENELSSPTYFSDIEDGDCVMMYLSQQGSSKLRAMDCEARAHYACQLP